MEVPYRAIIIDVEVPLQTGTERPDDAAFPHQAAASSSPARAARARCAVEARAPLLLLLGVTALVLITACANIANLLLARAAGRSAEMAVRLSIGASRWQVLRQLLVESCTLALLGGLAGLLVSRWTLTGIAALLPPEAAATVPSSIDGSVLLYALALSLGTGLVFGLYPALHSTRPDLVGVLKGHSGQPSGARAASRFRTGLATSQIALSMALLAAAGLFTKSLYNVSRVDLGLATDRLVTFGVSPALNGYPKAQSLGFFERVEAALAALPGARSVSASTVSLIAGNNWNNSMRVQGFEAGPDTNTSASFSLVGPDFFRTLGIPLMPGPRVHRRRWRRARPRWPSSTRPSPASSTSATTSIGTRVGTGRDSTGLDIEIVGLVQDAKYSEVKDAIPPQIFRPYRQGGDESVGSISFYVHTDGDAAALLGPAQAAVRALDPNLPVENPKTMAQQVRENVFLDRMISTLSAGFAVLATVLAAIGLYGVLAYTVTQRTREFGLRMALGADGARCARMVLGHVARMTAVGGRGRPGGRGRHRPAGAVAALRARRATTRLVLAVSATLLALVAAAAGLLPALRASRIAADGGAAPGLSRARTPAPDRQALARGDGADGATMAASSRRLDASRSTFVALCLLFVVLGRLRPDLPGAVAAAALARLRRDRARREHRAGQLHGRPGARQPAGRAAGAARPSAAGVRRPRGRHRRVGAGHAGAARRRRGPLPAAVGGSPAIRSGC